MVPGAVFGTDPRCEPKNEIRSPTVKISVIGCGYLGAVHAACMAELGHDVIGVDVDQAKIDALEAATAPFFEPGLPELLESANRSGRLRFTTDMSEVADAAVHFIAVGTPQKKGEYAADLTYVDAAVTSLLPHLRDGALVVGKSTVPVGTAARLAVAAVSLALAASAESRATRMELIVACCCCCCCSGC